MQLCQQTYEPARVAANRGVQLRSASHGFRAVTPFGLALVPITMSAGATHTNTASVVAEPMNKVAVSIGDHLRETIADRVAELRECADEDDIQLSEESAELLGSFIGTHASRMPAIVYTDGGFFRAIWRNSSGEQAALIFRSAKEVQFVFFAMRDGDISRATGIAAIDDLPELLQAHMVAQLLRS